MQIEMEICRIIINEMSDQQVVVLKETEGERAFPIVIGMVEVFALDRVVNGIKCPRPMTHDLIASVIEALGATVERLVICDIRDHVFYGNLVLSIGGREEDVDCRPSDGMVIAAMCKAPISAEERVFEKLSEE